MAGNHIAFFICPDFVVILMSIMKQIVYGLLETPVEDLGFQFINVPGWTVVAGLGLGRFSSVYSCKRTGSKSTDALKYFDVTATMK